MVWRRASRMDVQGQGKVGWVRVHSLRVQEAERSHLGCSSLPYKAQECFGLFSGRSRLPGSIARRWDPCRPGPHRSQS